MLVDEMESNPERTQFERDRYMTATKEIFKEILQEKYNLEMFEAAVLLLHSGIETLNVADAMAEPE